MEPKKVEVCYNVPMEDLSLICLSSFKERGKAVEAWIKKERNQPDANYILDISQVRFSNGEGKIILNQTARGKDVYILADVGNYSCTYKMFGADNRMSPDDHFQDIKRAVSAASRRSRRITVIMPLLYASRQHRRMSRESLDCAVALQELERMGVARVVTFDAHDPNIVNAIPLSSFDNASPTYSIISAFAKSQAGKIDKDNTIVISPDYGAMGRAIKVATILGLDVGIVYKRRDYSTIIKGSHPIIGFAYTGPEVKGKSVIVVDDMIASGKSILEVATHLKKQGVGDITVFTSFALFNEGTSEFDKLYKDGIIKSVYSTNLSYLSEEVKNREWFHKVDLTPHIAKIINALNNDKSIAPHIENFEDLNKLLDKG